MIFLAKDIEQTLASLRRGKLRIRIPRSSDLFRRRPKSFFHPYPELFIQTGGATDFECPGESFRLGTREVCVMPTGVPHAETPIDLKAPYGIIVFMRARDGFLAHRATASIRRSITASHAEHLISSRGRSAFRYLEEMSAQVAEIHRAGFRQSLLEVFLVTMLSELHRPSGGEESQSPLIAESEKLARTLLGNSELSVAGIASTLRCSANYLSRRFHEERGMTLGAWITRERLELARDLLSEPKHSVAEIGWMCGFSSPSYFVRVFRQQTGFTPRAWREAANT